jgi:enterochelin esterase family protein
MLSSAALYLLALQDHGLDLEGLERLIASSPASAAKVIREHVNADELVKGANPIDVGTRVLFAVRTEQGVHRVVLKSKGNAIGTLTQVDDTLYALVKPLKDGDAFLVDYELDGKPLRQGLQVEVYEPNPLVQSPPGGMKGELRDLGTLKSTTYPGTTRKWFVYLPPNLDASHEYPVLVGQDAQWDRQWMANALENCAREGVIPPTVGVFIEPGQNEPGKYSNRSAEYDPLTDVYTKFLLGEVLPEVEKIVKLSHEPGQRALAGMSSGGICSFNACWERPDTFGVALSFIGSYANIASGASKRDGGHNFPFLIRKTDKKPIRVFLQDGANDLDNEHGNWWLCNQQMEAALRFKGYDFVWNPGQGFHSSKHARRIFDRALRFWLGKQK